MVNQIDFVNFALAMRQLLSFIYFKCLGWKTDISVPKCNACVMCVAPHTSNRDFFYAMLFDRSQGGHAHFLMKKFWFFWPLGILLRKWGGIAVDRSHRKHMTEELASMFKTNDNFRIAITPEGTRSANDKWKLGFYYIALKANVPIRLYVLNYKTKSVICKEQIIPSGNVEKDILYIKKYYAQFKDAARYPKNFSV